MTTTHANSGESWDLASEYPSADSAAIDADFAELDALFDARDRAAAVLRSLLDGAETLSVDQAATGIEAAREAFVSSEAAERILNDLETYAECLLSVDSSDEAAQALLGRLQACVKRNDATGEPLRQFLDRVPDAVAEAFLADERTAPARFVVEHARKRRRERLSLEQETLASSLAQDGIHAWGRLYDQLSGTLTCEVPDNGDTRIVGLAEASGLLLAPDDSVRESAWRAINTAWDQHVESCSAAINAIAGWRLEMCGRRGTHFLDAPLHMNRIERATLDTILGVAEEAVPLARRAARLQAKAYGKPRYGPWDQRAPAPSSGARESTSIPYREAVDIIATSYGSIDPRMGDFVRMMSANRWIEGTVGGRKRPGAYCTRFRKSRSPRVYMTYTGGASDVITLAHELGHAFHAWVMRELPECQRSYGMSIAGNGQHVRRDRRSQRATRTRRDAGGGTRDRVAGGGGADRIHTEHPHPVRVRTQLLRGARTTPAAAGRTEGHDERRLAQMVRRQPLRTRPAVLGKQAALLYFRLELLQFSLISSATCSALASTHAAKPEARGSLPGTRHCSGTPDAPPPRNSPTSTSMPT